MNLKLVVASMSVLGLVSCPVLAASHSKHKHKHQTASRDYKDMGTMPVQKDEPVCTISQNTVIMDGMTQNYGRSVPNPCNPGWFNRVQMAGGVNVDIGKFGNRNANYMGENYQRLSLNDAYLNIAADVSDWAKAFASLSYMDATTFANPAGYKGFGQAEYSAAYANNVGGSNQNNVQIEQAFATFGNLDQSPFFLQVGKNFQDFSRYEIHPITASMTQVLSETLATALKVGFIANGFHGSVYGFDDILSKSGVAAGAASATAGLNKNPTNYGASLGYDAPSDTLGWDAGLGYLYNMLSVDDVAYAVTNFNNAPIYHNRASAGAVYADVNSGPFTIGARYTAALQRFSPLDMTKNGAADLTPASALLGNGVTQVSPTGTASGAKPWAAGIQAGYGFDGWGKNQNVYLGYQASREAAGANLPKSRWLVGYGIDMFKSTHWGVEWDHDMAYNAANGGTGNNTNLVTLRSTVKFG